MYGNNKFKKHDELYDVTKEILAQSREKKNVALNEAEQLDELSKKTLRSYIKKANKSAEKINNNISNLDKKSLKHPIFSKERRSLINAANKQDDKLIKRNEGLGRAKNRLRNEETEHLSETDVSSMAKNAISQHSGTGRKKWWKINMQKKMTAKKNTAKMNVKTFNEDVEQLDELSKKTLGSYIKKASNSLVDVDKNTTKHDSIARKLAKQGQWNAAKKVDKIAAKSDKKYLKRETGISRAVDKITKESTDVSSMAKNAISQHSGTGRKKWWKINMQKKIAAKKAAKGLS